MIKAPLRPSKPIPNAATKSPMSANQLEARYSDLPLKHLIRIRLKDLGISNIEMQTVLGYQRPNVIAMIKMGSMRLPEGKGIETADLLKVDRTFLLGKVISENNPELWDAITTIMGDRLVTANELALIKFVRAGLDGHDADIMGSYEFGKTIAPAIAEVFKRESALTLASLDRTDS
jgi:hypothetical protein